MKAAAAALARHARAATYHRAQCPLKVPPSRQLPRLFMACVSGGTLSSAIATGGSTYFRCQRHEEYIAHDWPLSGRRLWTARGRLREPRFQCRAPQPVIVPPASVASQVARFLAGMDPQHFVPVAPKAVGRSSSSLQNSYADLRVHHEKCTGGSEAESMVCPGNGCRCGTCEMLSHASGSSHCSVVMFIGDRCLPLHAPARFCALPTRSAGTVSPPADHERVLQGRRTSSVAASPRPLDPLFESAVGRC
ncbi:hypothetical protein EJ03DRAFT_100021 [Teratosphaeria nubilosa]|uniref:Uncharacterized protein n=1 Tax=Teratosphaeria nubilosa TaxID=161662 RepID=A0A6G1L9G4_9PEZI|nr:hypothetical protein EJ03DRAFT_100021 [Teratosphaeria nubilosa]